MAHTALRSGGIILIGGAVLLELAIVLVSSVPMVNQPFPPHISLLFLFAAILLLLSLPAMYARQAQGAGWLGLIGRAHLQTGILLLLLVAGPFLPYPSRSLILSENLVHFLLGIALTLGILLTGIATIRARVYPRAAGNTLLAATVGFCFDFFGALLALALAWIGAALSTSKPTLSV